MPLPLNIPDLYTGRVVEWERLEFKEGWNPQAVVRSLCAFAKDFHNWGGGYLVIGVAEKNGQPLVPPQGITAKGTDERELISLASTVPFDDRSNHSARLADLSRDLMVEFLRQVKSDLAKPAQTMSLPKLARQMNLSGGPAESPMPRNVGLLFFHPKPHTFFPQTQIDVVWFPQGAAGDRFEEKTFRGPLGRMVREALDYIRRNYLNETVSKHPNRAESTRVANFPYAAVEEALVNAIYHRSYEEREPVEVRISPEELAVLSFPGPDRSIALADLRRGKAVARRYRNRRIGEFLKELDLTEGRATGIPKILRAIRANGSPAPKFETDEDRTTFLIRLPVHRAATPPLDRPVTPEVTPEVRRLLSTFTGEHSHRELQEQLDLRDDDPMRIAYLASALAVGLIERTIPDKPNSRLQKYRLTPKGRAWLTQTSRIGKIREKP